MCQGAQQAASDLVAFLRMRGFSCAPEAPLIVVRQHRRISIRLVQSIVQKLREKAGIAACSPHSLRHFLATQLVERTGDVVATSRILGHSPRSLAVTQRYVGTSPERLAEVMSALDGPPSPRAAVKRQERCSGGVLAAPEQSDSHCVLR